MPPRRNHLNFILFGTPSGWDDKAGATDLSPQSAFSRYVAFAQQAERAKIDAFFKADFLGFDKHNIVSDPSLLGEPLAITSALAAVTERIGLVVTASTSFSEPYNIARQIATLHNVSGGRAGWNAVTSFNGESNFGPRPFDEPAERYARAAEFVEVVQGLWQTWSPDALSLSANGSPAVDSTRIADLGHVGRYYSVEQALDVARLVESLPVVFQAGASDAGVRFSARFGEAVFVATPDFDHARAYYTRIKDLVAAAGRHPDALRVLPGLRTYVADTEREAVEQYQDVFAESNFYTSRLKFVEREAPLFDFEGLQLDDVITPDRIPSPEALATNNRRISRGLLLRDLATEVEGITLRQFLQRIRGSGHLDVVGTAEQVADTIATWFTNRASDGFTLHGGNSFDRFTDEVIPILQDKGIHRRDYPGTTLRENFGLESAVPVGV